MTDAERRETLERPMLAHGTQIKRFCTLQLRDAALAEDAAQEVFVKAWKGLASFRAECGEKTWLTRIAVNTCRDYQRTGWFRFMDRSLTPEELRKHIIMVPQYESLFSGTIADNLRIASPNASCEELWSALSDVRLKDWVSSLPQGLDTPVGDGGGKLSGGQRQKIGIARALLSRAEYIIFDEATSSVDMDSEREIWSCIGELSKTRTLIIISHRLSTIQNADIIYMLSNGGVTERGRHRELMDKGGLYRRLVEEQSRLEQNGKEGILYGAAL